MQNNHSGQHRQGERERRPIPGKQKQESQYHNLMVVGTTSDCGKSLITAALCRSLKRRGLNIAPFKAQNMSNNSWVTREGGEMGRSQVVQARAAGVEPHVDMNPVLLKPSGPSGSQCVVCGRALEHMSPRAYYKKTAFFKTAAFNAYDRLRRKHDILVLEGAGSPAEINLLKHDFVNMAMAHKARAHTILVADIELGGVFASISGTISLLPAKHRSLIRGIIINKFRGDPGILSSGIRKLEAITHIPVLGVVPYIKNVRLEEEDSMALDNHRPAGGNIFDIAVVHLPHISNFTDIQPLEAYGPFSVRFVSDPQSLMNPDLIILPGTKNTRSDMGWLRSSKIDRALKAAAARQVPILGICGGYQLLGQKVEDKQGIEGKPGVSECLGLLPVVTRLEAAKELAQVECTNRALPFLPEGALLKGYEIHMGRTRLTGTRTRALLDIKVRNACKTREGAGCRQGLVMGAYVHGLFDNACAVKGAAAWLANRRGLALKTINRAKAVDFEAEINKLTDIVESHLDMKTIYKMAGL